jgi:very-short-patch-repair endonuclease
MRKSPTPEENLMWEHLRNRRLGGYKFRRQHPIDRFIVDFYCVEAGLAIEIDGDVHRYRPVEDAARQEFLEARQIEFLRFSNALVNTDLEAVLAQISTTLSQRGSPSPRRGDGVGG